MSTNLPSKWVHDEYRAEVNDIVTESAFFSSMIALVDYRNHMEGLTKTELSERLGKDKGSITKITCAPSNMKIRTIARMADALSAHAVLMFVAHENSSLFFTSTGIRDCSSTPLRRV